MPRFIDPEKGTKKRTELVIQFLSQSDLNWYDDSYHSIVSDIKNGINQIEKETLNDADYRLIKREIIETVIHVKSDEKKSIRKNKK